MPVTRNPRRAQRGLPHCVFSRGGRDFAVPVGFSGQVIVGGVPRSVPGSPLFLVGLLDSERGSVPLLSIDAWFDLSAREYAPGSQVLLVEANEFRVGVVVDRVREVKLVDETEVTSPAQDESASPLVRGLWQGPARDAIIIDAEFLVNEALVFRHRMPEWGPVPKEDPTRRKQNEGREEFCIFTRGDRELALPIAAAREMLGEEAATPVPQAPVQLSGVLNLRGELLPLVRIDSWLGLPERPAAVGGQIVVVESGDVLVGIVVDRVRDVRGINVREIESYDGPRGSNGIFRGMWRGGGRRVTILDAGRLVEAAVDAVTNGFRKGQVAAGPAVGDAAAGNENTR